jgi:hypothetical protein
VLSGMGAVSSNYPDSSVQTAFNSATNSQSLTGMTNVTYSAAATLLEMRPITIFGGANSYLTKWQITSQGNISGARNATVQVVGTFERAATPVVTYAISASGNACPSVNFTSGTLNSWDSSKGTYATTVQASGASIASNGNVTLNGGSTAIDGTIYSALNTTVGSSCTDGLTNSSGSTPAIALISPRTYTNPTAPSPMTPTTNINQNGSSSCDSSWSSWPGACTYVSSGKFTIAPNTPATGYGNLTSNQNLHLSAGTYYFNSLQMNGGSITLDSVPVVINLGGNGVNSGNTLFATNSSTVINDGGVPANLQIVSACCTTGGVQWSNPPVITMNSSSSMYALIYAPNSYIHLTGSSQFLGAVVGQKVTSDSSGGFSYDQGLKNLVTLGAYYPTSFTWSKY